MNRQTKALLERARRSIASAAILPRQDPGDSVSRLYGGAFYAEAARFCNRGQPFRKPSAAAPQPKYIAPGPHGGGVV